MIASDQTGIPMDKIDVVWGDTDLVPKGGGTMGSRSLQQGGVAVHVAAGELVEQARKHAARLLEANEEDVVFDKESASFHVTGTPAVAKAWADLSIALAKDGGLIQETDYVSQGATFPFGAHVSVVEVDTETGQVKMLRHVACDDAGKVLNPLLLEGQIHGGIAQGAAQALLEEVRYDGAGNPITSNFADYAFISAAELPSFEVIPPAIAVALPIPCFAKASTEDIEHTPINARLAVSFVILFVNPQKPFSGFPSLSFPQFSYQLIPFEILFA
jgi:carbon-monoxide dehydrogenase large subunit